MKPVPCMSIEDVFRAVEDGRADAGVVPIENSVEGSVNATLDELAFESDLHIRREFVRDIHNALIVAPGVKLRDITTVVSHPQATAQCRGWLAKKLSGRPVIAANSTAEAVQRAVAEPGVAAVATQLAADLYGGDVLASAIEDHKGNQTRFVEIGRGVCPPTGHDKTSLALFIRQSKPGALLMILSEFAYGRSTSPSCSRDPPRRRWASTCSTWTCRGTSRRSAWRWRWSACASSCAR
jgi:prephenate dehydratase